MHLDYAYLMFKVTRFGRFWDDTQAASEYGSGLCYAIPEMYTILYISFYLHRPNRVFHAVRLVDVVLLTQFFIDLRKSGKFCQTIEMLQIIQLITTGA